MADYQVAIIGGGFCGTAVAIGCAFQRADGKIALIERRPIAGPGLAYGTEDPDHLLNVRAETMGAFPDRPRDFLTWLETQSLLRSYSGADFVPRKLYGDYLRARLSEALQAAPGLHVLGARITSLRHSGSSFKLTADDGTSITADQVVLALGNFPPEARAGDKTQDPYSPEVWERAAGEGDVLIVGTGLTALDMVVTLAKMKRSAAVHLLSRHGLLPREHRAVAGPPFLASFDGTQLPRTALDLFRQVRAHVARAIERGHSWQAAIDGLRPFNQKLWQNLNRSEQKRFLRHLRAPWDVHRHRCAPEVMDAYRKLEAEGRIFLHHGSILSEQDEGGAIQVRWRRRGTDNMHALRVRHVIRCTGPDSNLLKLKDDLVHDLLASGLIVPDALSMGIMTGADYIALGRDGPTTGLYSLGSLLKGRLYETVAVPELRQQAADISSILSEKVQAAN